jgi:hypothetical protein
LRCFFLNVALPVISKQFDANAEAAVNFVDQKQAVLWRLWQLDRVSQFDQNAVVNV